MVLIWKQFKANQVLVQISFNQEDKLNYSTISTLKVFYIITQVKQSRHTVPEISYPIYTKIWFQKICFLSHLFSQKPITYFSRIFTANYLSLFLQYTSSWSTYQYFSCYLSLFQVYLEGFTIRYPSSQTRTTVSANKQALSH